MRVEVDSDIEVSAKTVAELRKAMACRDAHHAEAVRPWPSIGF
jgi:hypothetical protein